MIVPILGAVMASIVNGAAALRQRLERAHRNAHAISYLEGMPAYLRNDIGLHQDAEIRRLVEQGRSSDAAERDVSRNLGTMCHSS